MVVYSDSSFANNADGSTQIGYIILLADCSGQCCFLSFRSLKARRVIRSSTAGETIAFAEAYDAAATLRADLECITGRRLELLMLTDSESLFYTITRDKYTKEKRLLLDIAAVREAYAHGEISNIGLIAGADNPSDALTKSAGNARLTELMTRHEIRHPIRQWVKEEDMRAIPTMNRQDVLSL
jgi:hypothetical protein